MAAVIENPIVRGTSPDPSVVRVGGSFFLATSTFGLLPGITIRHSTDLTTWTVLGGAVTRPAQYRRDGQDGGIELFAPTLRHNDGTFYLVCTNVADNQGNFLLTATDPAGPWSDAVWLDRDAFDPSLLFDEGRCYYTRRSHSVEADGSVTLGPIVQAVLDPETGDLGPFQSISAMAGGFCSNDIEGPHVYRRGDWYYLLSAEGGSWTGHMETCARSRSPWGPFEPAPHNPVLTHRHRVGHKIQTLGHADLFDDEAGNWWAVALGTRHEANHGFVVHHNLGRETFLMPVQWTDDGWPVIGNAGTAELVMELPHPLPGQTSARLAAAGGELVEWKGVGWQPTFRARPDGEIDLPLGNGLETGGPGALLLAQTEDQQSFSVTLKSVGPHGHAGIAAYSDARHFVCLTGTIMDGRFAGSIVTVIDDLHQVTPFDVAAPHEVRLRMEASSRHYEMGIEDAEGGMSVIGKLTARLLSAQAAEWFVGVHFALVGIGPSTQTAHFERVEVDGAPVLPRTAKWDIAKA